MLNNNKVVFVVFLCQIIIGVWALFYILYVGREILLPIIYAIIFAILLNPLVNLLCRKGFNRVISIFIAIVLAFIMVGGIIYFVGSQATRFSETFPALQQKLSGFINDAIHWFSKTFNVSSHNIDSWIDKTKGEGMNSAGMIIGKTLLSLTGMLVIVFLLPVYIFMFLFYKPLLLDFVSRLFPKEKHSTVAEVLTETKTLIQSYLIGLLVEALIIATLNSVGLLVLGIQYAILLGIIGAILNIIPYVGGILAIALPVIIALATKTPIYALWVFIIYIVIQFTDNHFIVPKIVASKVKINALISLIVVFLGGAMWGVAGMFLSIPLTAIIKVIFDRIDGLKPWGFLLGDTMPPIGKIIFRFKLKKKK